MPDRDQTYADAAGRLAQHAAGGGPRQVRQMRRLLALLPGAVRGRAVGLVRLQSQDLQGLRHLRQRVSAACDHHDSGGGMSVFCRRIASADFHESEAA